MANPKYAVVIFAYNIGSSIEACLNSVINNGAEAELKIFVLANGCKDSTERVVKKLQIKHANIELVSIKKADKCNAWNKYVHELAPFAQAHFCIDGDVEIMPEALSSISKLIQTDSQVNIVGGVPVVGRDKHGWINRMQSYGRVSGGLYALSDVFLQQLKSQKIAMPIGFVGEDFLISGLAKNLLDFSRFNLPSPKLRIEVAAGFSFRSLSKKRIQDYWGYAKRLIRYRVRDYELAMLLHHFEFSYEPTLPSTVQVLYEQSRVLPDYYWRGKFTPIDWIAVYKIRRLVVNKTSRFSKLYR